MTQEGGWLGKGIRRFLRDAVPEETGPQTRSLLLSGQRGAAEVRLRVLDDRNAPDHPMWTALHSVVGDHLIVLQPHHEGGPWYLKGGQVVELTVDGPQGRFLGTSRTLGPASIDSGSMRPLAGYRLSIPAALTSSERRQTHRVSVAFDLAPVATFFCGPGDRSIDAAVLDLSIGGARMRCHCLASDLFMGLTGDLRVHLPEPVGDVLIPCEVAAMSPDRQNDRCQIGVRFVGDVPGIEPLIRSIELRRAARRRVG
jgi:hypothetical protein